MGCTVGDHGVWFTVGRIWGTADSWGSWGAVHWGVVYCLGSKGVVYRGVVYWGVVHNWEA